MKTENEKLAELISEVDKLQNKIVTDSNPDFCAWKMKVERFLISNFGKESYEYEEFQKISFGVRDYTIINATHNDWISACNKGLRKAKAFLTVFVEELQADNQSEKNQMAERKYNRVFIVHGHNGELKEKVARIIEKQGIEAIILSEQANTGKTIIEKIEANSDVGSAICLFTADDIGQKKSATEGQPRARQNVVFEAGYFMGKLGRDRVVFLADSGIELPSDLSGVVYTNTENWQVELLKELRTMGYQVDFNKLF